MASKVEGSGRTKGTPNKRTLTAIETAEELGIDPFKVLLYFAIGDYKSLGLDETKTLASATGDTYEVATISPELMQKSANDATKYLLPQRKAVELSNDSEGNGFKVIIEDYSSKK